MTIQVKKGEKTFPFSRGILARSISSSGLSYDEAYEIVVNIRESLHKQGITTISAGELEDIVSKELLKLNLQEVERFYRVRRKIQFLRRPIFVLIGGGTGVGKTTMAAEVGHQLGIKKIIGTDTIREILRAIIPQEVAPTLHSSSFLACDELKGDSSSNTVLYGFKRQAKLVNHGIIAVLTRGKKEGLKMVIDGVHLVPGGLQKRFRDPPGMVFQYVLDVPDRDRHIQRFYSRVEGSLRDPQRYIDYIDRIRDIHHHLVQMAKRHGIKIVNNTDYEEALEDIVEDVLATLETDMEK
ncbi:MAG: 2-phosphoglycerate kinase [Candidatus Korarchaeota archaeon]|nr:2-phosphoglycerate kinase [Candidatus Korarchaeota archaeon]NIU82915.1 2-phosphoglycerate kinase [Candidatus Thorarchaeota archaeon]NIW14181.1 2-phosphoglycerate kinase [Candidatus Thorarchaeota archaeon]NIW52289.1 2-phosphoglycerate kinase [Candidatus Korarchaeota archaeon]